MTESVDLDRIAMQVRDAAETCGAMILESVLSSESVHAVAVDGDTFPALVAHLKPRLIYMALTRFDSVAEVFDHFEVEELDRNLKKLATKWAPKNGGASRLILGLMADGVLHGIVETVDWFDDFEQEVEALLDTRAEDMRAAFDREQEAERSRRETEEKKRLSPIVKKLIADSRFNAPKISASKRLTLAETLFPDEDRRLLKKAVERAISEAWLAGSDK